jgi:membrane-bound serine protease (ClpP class)
MLPRCLIWVVACLVPLTSIAQKPRTPAPAKLAAPKSTGVNPPAAAPAAAPAEPVLAPVTPEAAPVKVPAAPVEVTPAPVASIPATVGPASNGYVPNKARSLPLQQVNPGGAVYVFPFKGEFDDKMASFFRRAVKDAERAHASAFVIDMDSYGGRVDVLIEMEEMLTRVKMPTLTFINPNAGSAGALLALGTKRIYMRPNSVIGAAAVVGEGGIEIGKTMKAKEDSYFSAKFRGICEANGHNPDIGEAFMLIEKELKVGDKVIDGKETLLSLTGREATQLYDGRPLLADGLVDSIEEMLKAEGLTGPLVRVKITGFETLAFWITQLSFVLIIGGIVGAFIEMKVPGFGLPGICSLICFGLFFAGHYIAGLAGYEVIFIFFIGLILALVEVFVFPGTFVTGLIGTLMMLGALLWAMVDDWPGSPGLPGGMALERPMTNLVIALVGAGVVMAILTRYLPKTTLYRRLVLSTASAEGPAVSVPMVNLTVRAGDLGSAATVLRPAGKGLFQGEVHDVLTNGEFLPAGTPIRVLETDGLQVLVEKAG